MKRTNIRVIEDHGMYSEISISGLSGILVDNEDIPKIMAYSWYLDKSKAKRDALYYFKANLELISKNPYRYKMVSLHRFIMNQLDYDGIHVIDHINQDSKDNRKENLRYVDIKTNMNNCRKNIIRPDFIDYKVEPIGTKEVIKKEKPFIKINNPVSAFTIVGNIRVTKLIDRDIVYIIQVLKQPYQSKRNKVGYPGISYDKQHKKWRVYDDKKSYGFFEDIEDAFKQAYIVYKLPYEIYKQ